MDFTSKVASAPTSSSVTGATNKQTPEEVGFLCINGTKYPIRIGLNKIGRDPETSNIVLSFHTVSRQHAVINISNSKNYMILDLKSANSTKLCGKRLQPYKLHELKNGDILQFGRIFGVFKLLEDDNELPKTQLWCIPDTPEVNNDESTSNKLPSITIPESQDFSEDEYPPLPPSMEY